MDFLKLNSMFVSENGRVHYTFGAENEIAIYKQLFV